MASEVIHVVDPDQGSGWDYDSLSAWEAGQQRNLTTVDEQATAKCRSTGGSADTTATTIVGWTTGVTQFIKVWTDTGESYRHTGKWDASKYRLEVADAVALTIREDYVRVEGLQLGTSSGNANDQHPFAVTLIGASNDIRISQSILKGHANALYRQYGLYVSDASTILSAWNNVIFNVSGYAQTRGMVLSVTTAYLFSNTITEADQYGILVSAGTVVAKNNALKDCGTCFSGTFDSGSTHNVTDTSAENGVFGATWSTGTTTSASTDKLIDSGATFQTDGVQVGSIVKNTTDTTYTYVTNVDSETQLTVNDDIFASSEGYEVYTNIYGSVTFDNAAGDDFHLDSTDTVAMDKGTDLSSDPNLPFSDDVDDDTRSGTWDIGADEYTAAAGVAPTGGIFGPLSGPFAGPLYRPFVDADTFLEGQINANVFGRLSRRGDDIRPVSHVQ